jgi:FAD:protein FMN transferase
VLIAALAAVSPGCDLGAGETELSGQAQGTTYHIKVVLHGLAVDQQSLDDEIGTLFRAVDEKLSNYREDSEISRLNRDETTAWLTVSPEIMQLLIIGREVNRASSGCYDLTVKPLFDLWGFSKPEHNVPDPGEIARTLQRVGMPKLEIDAAHLRIRKTHPGLQIDLSSIAQGYTVAAISAALERRGVQNYLVEIGGELKVKGRKANGREWRVAIEKPVPMTREVQKILDIHERAGTAVMTSGTYRNFFEDGGQVFSHIIDPRTGKPVNHRLLSVTVLHDDPTWADAWSTALMCLGEQQGPAVAAAQGLKVLFIHHQADRLEESFSPAFGAAGAAP